MIMYLDVDERQYMVRIIFMHFNNSPLFLEIYMFARIEDVFEP
jgi:hypothetical protein